jgi:hypothetical protein
VASRSRQAAGGRDIDLGSPVRLRVAAQSPPMDDAAARVASV